MGRTALSLLAFLRESDRISDETIPAGLKEKSFIENLGYSLQENKPIIIVIMIIIIIHSTFIAQCP